MAEDFTLPVLYLAEVLIEDPDIDLVGDKSASWILAKTNADFSSDYEWVFLIDLITKTDCDADSSKHLSLYVVSLRLLELKSWLRAGVYGARCMETMDQTVEYEVEELERKLDCVDHCLSLVYKELDDLAVCSKIHKIECMMASSRKSLRQLQLMIEPELPSLTAALQFICNYCEIYEMIREQEAKLKVELMSILKRQEMFAVHAFATSLDVTGLRLLSRYLQFQWPYPSIETVHIVSTMTPPCSMHYAEILRAIVGYVCTLGKEVKERWIRYIIVLLKNLMSCAHDGQGFSCHQYSVLFYRLVQLTNNHKLLDDCLSAFATDNEEVFFSVINIVPKILDGLATDSDQLPVEVLKIADSGKPPDGLILLRELRDLHEIEPWWLEGSHSAVVWSVLTGPSSTPLPIGATPSTAASASDDHTSSTDSTNPDGHTSIDSSATGCSNDDSSICTSGSTQYSRTMSKSKEPGEGPVTICFIPMAPNFKQFIPQGDMTDAQFGKFELVAFNNTTIIEGKLVHPNFSPGKFHARLLSYNALCESWKFENVMIDVTGKLNVDDSKKGAFRDAYHVHVPPLPPSLLKIQRKPENHDWRGYLAECRSQEIARYYVQCFEYAKHRCHSIAETPLTLFMAQSSMLVIFEDCHSGSVLEFGSLETYGGDKFMRFTNNSYYVNDKFGRKCPDVLAYLLAFMHFTYQESGGTLMVTDLQGFMAAHLYESHQDPGGDYENSDLECTDGLKIILTDPAIHSILDDFKRLGCGNLEEEGFEKFFRHQHPKCNQFCHGLDLKRPAKYSSTSSPNQ